MIVNNLNIIEALDILRASPEEVWSIDLETYNPFENTWFMEISEKQRPLNRLNSRIVSLQLVTPSGLEMYFDFNHKQENEDLRLDYKYLADILSLNKSGNLIAHNAVFEYGLIRAHGYDCPDDFYDTMIMGVLYNENVPQGLKGQIKNRFGHTMLTYKETVGEGSMKDITAEEGYSYGMGDAVWTLKLYDFYLDKINLKYYETFEMDLIKIVAIHYEQGQAIDLQELDKIQAEDLQSKELILQANPRLKLLNINSPKQVGNWLYNELGLQPFKVSKATGIPSTDKESLYELESTYGRSFPIIKAFGELRKIETRLKLYYKPYPKLVYPDGKLHSEIRQTGTVTGRFSMNSPNLQQVSKRGEGVKVRGVIVPFTDRGHDCIVSIDWSQIELRIAAHVSKDPKLVDAYVTAKDLHTVSGTNISGDTYEVMQAKLEAGDKDSKIARQKGKTLNFAALYLAGAKRLAAYDLLDCTEAEADQFLQAHKQGYYGYFYDYVDKINSSVKLNKFTKTVFGRLRHLPDATSPIKRLAREAQTQGLNFTIQGSAAELMKVGLITLFNEGLLFQDDFTFIAPVHDEYVFSANSEALPNILPRVVEIMEYTPKSFTVPILAEASIGPNFARQYELNHNFSIDNIRRARNTE